MKFTFGFHANRLLKCSFFTLLAAMVLLFSTNCSRSKGNPRDTHPLVPPAPPATPSLIATADDGFINFSWNATGGADVSYNLYFLTTPGVTVSTGNKFTSVTSPFKHTGLKNGVTYFYVVTAVNAAGESAASSEASATPANGTGSADPKFTDQWHLVDTGSEDINVKTAWDVCAAGEATCRGEGVRIAVVDDGLEIAHEDLAANIATRQSHNYVNGSSNPTNLSSDLTSGHGTAVAGIAAARDLNDLGVRGVAPRASLAGYNFLQTGTTADEADAMTRKASLVSVNTNSWGPLDGSGDLNDSSLAWRTAITTGLTEGRGGKGIIYTWAAGNGANGANVDNANYDGYANNRGVIAIGAVSKTGVKASYSERGANLWVSAPGGEFCQTTGAITSVDRTGAVGINRGAEASDYSDSLSYTKCMNGTSSAAPMVAGVAALVLQAKPSLGWRDVRLILATTARKNHVADAEWATNGAGLPINPNYGFGVVNASAAVAAAKVYGSNLGTEKTFETGLSSPNAAIPENVNGVSDIITVNGSGISKIEFIEITFSAANHARMGDLEISLTNTATAGSAVSLLAELHNCDPCTPYNGWVFGDAFHLNEPADGTWQLTVKDKKAGTTGNFQSWKLKFYGT